MTTPSSTARSRRLESGRLSLRARLTLLATGVVLIALALGAVLLVLAVRHSVLNSLDQSARQQAKDVAALASSGRLPDPVPVGAGTAGVQIVDAQDRVVAVSAGADRLTALLEPADVRAVRSGHVRVIGGARLGTPDSLRVVGYPVAKSGPSAGQTVLVAVSQAEATGSLRALAVATAIGAPLLVAGFALVCWLLVGRSLRPVSRLRTGAEEIAAAGRSDGRRLPVPLAQDEVRRLAETLNGMLDRLESASTAQRAFVADAAHELRSPLTAIRTQLEVARRHPGTATWEETADGVLADTDRLARLVDDLLLLARSGETSPQRERRARPVDLSVVAAEVAARPWSVPVDVVPASSDDVSTPTVVADPDTITRIVTNLVDNAARHARTGVRIASTATSARVEVSVTDDGPGIPEADRERVFERFARLDLARSRGDGGSGLGLAIVRTLVTASGGTVRLEEPSTPPGTRAVVSWPAGGPQRADGEAERVRAGD
jgi:signal transduction histidine kinase